MNTKILLPVLLALQLAAMALIVEHLSVDEGQSDDVSGAWQFAEWNLGCVAGHASEEISSHWSSRNWQPNAMVAEQRSCVNIR